MKAFVSLIILPVLVLMISCKSNKNAEFSKIKLPKNQFDIEAKSWSTFLPKNSSDIVLIDYFPASVRCGRGTMHGVAIVKYLDGDTIRIINQCPYFQEFKANDTLLFRPSEGYPNNLIEGLLSYNYDQNIFKYNPIKKTTYGELFAK